MSGQHRGLHSCSEGRDCRQVTPRWPEPVPHSDGRGKEEVKVFVTIINGPMLSEKTPQFFKKGLVIGG